MGVMDNQKMGVMDNQLPSPIITAEKSNPETLMPPLRAISERICKSCKLYRMNNSFSKKRIIFLPKKKLRTLLFTMIYVSYKIYVY